MARTLRDVLESQAPEKQSNSNKEVDVSTLANANESNYGGYSSKLSGTAEQRARDLYSLASMLAQEQANEASKDKRYWIDRPTSKKNLRESANAIYQQMLGPDAPADLADWDQNKILGYTDNWVRDLSDWMDDVGGTIGTGIDWAFDNSVGTLAGVIGGDKAGDSVRNWMTGDDLSWIPGAAVDIAALGLSGGALAPVVAARNAVAYSDQFNNALTGVDQITGQELNDQQRSIAGLAGLAGTALSAIPGTAAARGLGKTAAKAAGEAAEKTAKEGVEKAGSELTAATANQSSAIKALQKKYGLSDDAIKELFKDGKLDEEAITRLRGTERAAEKAALANGTKSGSATTTMPTPIKNLIGGINDDDALKAINEAAQQVAERTAAKTAAEETLANAAAAAAARNSAFDNAFGFLKTRMSPKELANNTEIGQALNGTKVNPRSISSIRQAIDAVSGKQAVRNFRADQNLAKQLTNGVTLTEAEQKAAQEAADRVAAASNGRSLGKFGANLGMSLLQNSANLGADSDNLITDSWDLVSDPNRWGTLAELGLLSLVGRRPGYRPSSLSTRGISPNARYGMQGDMFMRALREANPGIDDDSLLELYYMIMEGQTPEKAKKSAETYNTTKQTPKDSSEEGEE